VKLWYLLYAQTPYILICTIYKVIKYLLMGPLYP